MKKIKKYLIKLIGMDNYRTLIVKIFRFINFYHKKLELCVDVDKIKIIKIKKRNVFFGYYDHPSVNKDKVLFISTTDNKSDLAQVCIYDLKKEKIYNLASTKAWNYQMGSRLRWLNEDEIIFNDYDTDNGYISRIVNIKTKEEKKFPFPIYDIERTMRYSFYTDFTILNINRPEYGYDNLKIYDLKDNGIYRGDFESNSKRKILSIEDISSYGNLNNITDNYINHISCCPFSDTLMFFHLYKEKTGELKNRIFIIDYEGKIKTILNDFKRASHYTWKNDKEILLTVINENDMVEYRLYNIDNNSCKILDFLNKDGHPSYVSEDKFITDTYADHNGMQHLFLCDSNGIICEIAQIYHNTRKNDIYRCDLHPRYSNGLLTFDSISGKNRSQIVMKLDFNKSNLVDKNGLYPYISDNKRLYMFLTRSIEIFQLRYIFIKLFDTSYNAHVTLNNMFKTKSKIKKKLYFEKLLKKYSLFIHPKCKIGKNFYMVHAIGIVIGSGAVIGDNCKIYQQVTIGKEKGKFPIIGDNVTIYSGAKIIGDVKIGDNAIIGANAVVTRDVPDNCVAVGVPARVIKKV